ncbi:MAG TPA: acylphosphatase [Candidatus Mediterraneibacter norwichensis]|uniref:acylphosphatase n=1 Tax=Candidatus Mediterraneibacter stercoravium TaxID=2838685 RepID=A0A9D2K0I0_9FIRM|nr:acylphosphatase [Candidatus Mediterraneibacter norwichensis]HIZ74091.1 acylphosphatase [Candidatus Mediterraneibacter stercoravium]
MVRKHFFFSGRVQGVGFRYQSAYYARRLGLTGWVRNLSDGRVEMEVQGKESVIAQLVLELKNTSYIRIERVVCENLPLKEGEDKFSTRFTC